MPNPAMPPALFLADEHDAAGFDEADNAPRPSYRLFTHSIDASSAALVLAEHELREINDFCFAAIQSAQARVEHLKREARGLRDGSIKLSDPEHGDLSGEVADGMECDQIPHWESVAGPVAERAARLLLHDLLNRTLAELRGEFGGSLHAVLKDPPDLEDLTIPEALDRSARFLESLESSLPHL